MEAFLTFLKDNCLQARDETEFVQVQEFDEKKFEALKQDGFMVVQAPESVPIQQLKGVDRLQLSKDCLILRKNQPRQLAWLNPETQAYEFDPSQEPLYRRLTADVDHPKIISNVIALTNPDRKSSYVEYGVMCGHSLEVIAPVVNTAYAVDLTPYIPKHKNIRFYNLKTNTFSLNYLPRISFRYAFIDADHKSEQAFIDFEYIYKFCESNGFIFLHDTYPFSEKYLAPNLCNDCYKTPLKIRAKYPDIEMLTLPFQPGVTIVRKV
jgi:hypothetical protein